MDSTERDPSSSEICLNAEDFDERIELPPPDIKKRAAANYQNAQSPPKKIKIEGDEHFEPVHYAQDESDSGDEDFDPDPAYLASYRAAEEFKARVQEEAEEDRRYNVLRLAQQATGKAKVVRSAAENPAHLTKDEKRDLRLINAKNNGKPMTVVEAKLDKNHMVFLPCKPPDMAEVDRILGVSYARGKACFACTRGVGYPLMSGEMVAQLERFIDEVIPYTNFLIAALKISFYYHQEIQLPVNRHLLIGERPLPHWPPRQIYDHLVEHIFNPAYRRIEIMRELQQHRKTIRFSGLYETDSTIYEQAGRQPTMRDIEVNPIKHKMLMETYAQERAFMLMKPEQLSGFNEKMSGNTRRTIAPKSNTFHQRSITDFIN